MESEKEVMGQNSVAYHPVRNEKAKQTLLWMVLVAIVGLAAGGVVYSWREQEISRLNNELASVSIKEQPKDNQDEKVLAASEAFCEAVVPGEGYRIIFQAGTTQGETVRYSTDKKFATINAGCNLYRGDSTTPEGSGRAYYLKQVNDIWIVIAQTQQQLSPDIIRTYGIPADFN